MKPDMAFKRTAFGLVAMLFLYSATGCGGGGSSSSGGGGDGGNGTPLPQAVISVEPEADTVESGTTLRFDGSASHSESSSTLSYQWSVIQKPDGSQAELAGGQDKIATLVPDLAGEWGVSLVVNDGQASSSPAHRTFTVTPPTAPVAVIQPINGAVLGLAVQLDGSGSLPPGNQGDYSELTFEWALTAAPPGSTAALDSTSSAWPRFTPDKEGRYIVSLVVHDGDQRSNTVEQQIEVLADAAPPTAVATLVTDNPVRGQPVQLSALDSTEPQGNTLHYFWSFGGRTGQPYPNHGKPQGSKSVIENPTSATPSFTPDVAGKYTVMLMAWSGKRTSFTQIEVTVAKPDDAPNTPPVLVLPSAPLEAEPGIQYQNRVKMPDYSYDIDGDTLSREWTILSSPPGFDPNAMTMGWTTDFDPNTGYFLPTHEGDYVIQLRISDGIAGWSEPATQTYRIMTGANVAPTAKVKSVVGAKVTSPGGAMLMSNAIVGQNVILDGSASIGGNGDQVFYQWEMLYHPPTSEAVLSDVTSALPSFTADQEGPYLVRLKVKDNYGLDSSNQAEILITAKQSNSAPVLRPTVSSRYGGTMVSPEQPILFEGVGQPLFSIEANELDPDGDQVDVLLTLKDAPQGFVWPEKTQWAKPPASFSSMSGGETGFIGFQEANTAIIDTTGDYVFQIIASDGMDQSLLHTVTIPFSSVEDYPSLLLRGAENSSLYGWGERSFENLIKRAGLQHLVFGGTGFGNNASNWPIGGGWSHQSNWNYYAGEDYGDIAWLELRAPSGHSYTIIDVQANSEDPDVSVSFVGLEEGTRIDAEESLRFHLRTSVFPDRTDADTTYPKAIWSFRVKEKPEWVFNATMILAGRWHEQPSER